MTQEYILKANNLDGGYLLKSDEEEIFVHAVRNVSLELSHNEILGIAGESGCGKSTLAKMLYGVIEPPLRLQKGSVNILTSNGFVDIVRVDRNTLAKEIWWKLISYIPQNSMNVLNPMKRIHDIFIETFKFHDIRIDRNEVMKYAKDIFDFVGLPIEVLKAIEKYGELKKIESEIEVLSRRRDELESRVKELEGMAERLRSTIEEFNRIVSEVIKRLSDEINRGIENITNRFIESINKISSEYENYVKRFSELKAEAGKLEEELMLTRVIQTLIRYPSEAKNISLDYDIMMIRAIIKHCMVKGVNPRIRPLDNMREKYYSSPPSIELIDILEWAHKGLVEALRGEKVES